MDMLKIATDLAATLRGSLAEVDTVNIDKWVVAFVDGLPLRVGADDKITAFGPGDICTVYSKKVGERIAATLNAQLRAIADRRMPGPDDKLVGTRVHVVHAGDWTKQRREQLAHLIEVADEAVAKSAPAA